jgi:hypothetical protein
LITEIFEDLQIPNEVQSERHSKLKEIIDSTQDYHSLLEGQKLLYVELMKSCRIEKSVETTMVALDTVYQTSLLMNDAALQGDALNAAYMSVWKECIRNDLPVLQQITTCNEVNQNQWNSLCERSIFAKAISAASKTSSPLTNELLNNSFVQLNIDQNMLYTLQKLLHWYSSH